MQKIREKFGIDQALTSKERYDTIKTIDLIQ